MEAPALDSEPADTRVPPGLSGAVNLFAPEELDGPGLSRTLELLESLIGWAQAGQARILHLLEQHFQDAVANGAPAAAPGRESRADRVRAKRLDEELATSLAATEAACVLRIPERTALGRLRTSRALCEHFPATLGALRDGHLGYRQARTLVDEALSLPIEARAPFEAHLLGKAPGQTAAQLARSARREREKYHPETILERSRNAVADRRVSLAPDVDGMCWLSAFLPAEAAETAYRRLTVLARAVQGPDEPRTLTQLRADSLADLLTPARVPGSEHLDATPAAREAGAAIATPGPSPDHRGPEAGARLGAGIVEVPPVSISGSREGYGSHGSGGVEVFLTIDVKTLLGITDHPAELEGYGPVSPERARDLAALSGSFHPLLVSDTGNVLAMGRSARFPSAMLARWLRYRHETCRFPGCTRSAASSDIDHSVPWSRGGATDHGNLAHLCRKHHAYKSSTLWNLRENDAGILSWSSPTGRRYRTFPPGLLAEPPPF